MEAAGGELSAAVVCAAVGAEQAGHRAHCYDVAFAAFDHVGKKRLHGLKCYILQHLLKCFLVYGHWLKWLRFIIST